MTKLMAMKGGEIMMAEEKEYLKLQVSTLTEDEKAMEKTIKESFYLLIQRKRIDMLNDLIDGAAGEEDEEELEYIAEVKRIKRKIARLDLADLEQFFNQDNN